MEGLVVRLANAREACLTKSNAPPAIEVRAVRAWLEFVFVMTTQPVAREKRGAG